MGRGSPEIRRAASREVRCRGAGEKWGNGKESREPRARGASEKQGCWEMEMWRKGAEVAKSLRYDR
jgi:hypothetical protein